jgi:hypothetical protein
MRDETQSEVGGARKEVFFGAAAGEYALNGKQAATQERTGIETENIITLSIAMITAVPSERRHLKFYD